jgi:hypothetical protein
MVGLQILDLPIGVRVPASQPNTAASFVSGTSSAHSSSGRLKADTEKRQLPMARAYCASWKGQPDPE